MALRQIEFTGRIDAKDDEDIGSDEHASQDVLCIALVSDAQPTDLVRTALKLGGEVRVELDLHVKVADGEQVQVLGAARLYTASGPRPRSRRLRQVVARISAAVSAAHRARIPF
jgi:hypothetical protein